MARLLNPSLLVPIGLVVDDTRHFDRAGWSSDLPLGAVHEDRDRQKIGANRELAAGENSPGRNAELMRASLALPELARFVFVGRAAMAARANRLALGIGPAD